MGIVGTRVGLCKLMGLALGLAAFIAAAGSSTTFAQQARAVTPLAGEPGYKLIRSVSGTKTTMENGRLVVEDPRTVFYLPEDKELVFYFEWNGLPGPHRMEGVWMDPAGRVASVSAFDYAPTERRFGARWTLPVSPGIALGSWTFVVRIDGEEAGRHPFQLTTGDRPPDLPAARRPATPAEAYRRLQASVAFIEKMDGSGQVVSSSFGFPLASNQLLTAFEAVDGATRVRLRFPDGRTADVTELLAWDRWQNWAILPAEGLAVGLTPASTREWQIGDRVYSLMGSADGGTSIVDATIMGTARPPRSGERLTISASNIPESTGAPVLNEYGDVIAMMAEHTVPGAGSLPRPMTSPSATEEVAVHGGGYAIPIDLVRPGAASTPTAFARLAADGAFVAPLGGGRVHIAQATVAQGSSRETGWINSIDEKAVFSSKGGPFAIILNLRPKAKIRLTASCQLLDLDGRVLSKGKPAVVKANANEPRGMSWQVDGAVVPAGLYRVEITFDNETVWRTFVKITP